MSNQATRSHPLLRPGRWHLARPQSQALWTTASAVELADLFDDAVVRRRLEDFLRVVAEVVSDVETLLVFDPDYQQLSLAISMRPERSPRFAWDWIANQSSSFIRSAAGRISDAPMAGGR